MGDGASCDKAVITSVTVPFPIFRRLVYTIHVLGTINWNISRNYFTFKPDSFCQGCQHRRWGEFIWLIYLNEVPSGIQATLGRAAVFALPSPGAVVGVLHVGDADGGVADPVVHHRVHRDRHAVLGQHLASDDQWPMVSRLRWVSPPAVELQVWLSSGQPSRTTRCRGEQRKFLENKAVFFPIIVDAKPITWTLCTAG